MSSKVRRQVRHLIKEELKEIKIISEHAKRLNNRIKLYESRAISMNTSRRRINEGIFDMASEAFGSDAVIDTIKKYLTEMILDFLGFDRNNKVMYTLIQNVLEAIDYTEFMKYFGDNKCGELMDVATEAITETVVELGADKILSYLAGSLISDDAESIVDNIARGLTTVSKEALNEIVVEIVKGYLQEPLEEFVCKGSISDILEKASGSLGGLANLGDLKGLMSGGGMGMSMLSSLGNAMLGGK
jgi:uncharacterized membrane protein YheB (UPF0754 family)